MLDFAEINGFKISEGAQGIINSARRAEVIVAPKQREAATDTTSKLKEILASPYGVLDDLVDDE